MFVSLRLPIGARSVSEGKEVTLACAPGSNRVTSVFVVGVFLYLLAHLGVRLLESSSLRWDESEQVLFSQQLALGYNDQPPVYTWLLWGLFQLTGVSLLGVYLLKLLIVAAI